MNPAFLPRALTATLLALLAAVAPVRGQTLDKVSFGTNWVAEAEHGGFFQALADGTYKNYGLDVTIAPGGPNDNNRIALIADIQISRDGDGVVALVQLQQAAQSKRRSGVDVGGASAENQRASADFGQ